MYRAATFPIQPPFTESASPPWRDLPPEERLAIGSLQRLHVEHLDDREAEKIDATCNARAEHRHPIGGVSIEAELRRLVARPGNTRIEERRSCSVPSSGTRNSMFATPIRLPLSRESCGHVSSVSSRSVHSLALNPCGSYPRMSIGWPTYTGFIRVSASPPYRPKCRPRSACVNGRL